MRPVAEVLAEEMTEKQDHVRFAGECWVVEVARAKDAGDSFGPFTRMADAQEWAHANVKDWLNCAIVHVLPPSAYKATDKTTA
jgi:hypothetical protein